MFFSYNLNKRKEKVMIDTSEIFPRNEFLEVTSKAEEERSDRIKNKEEREREIQQIRGTIYAILDLVNTFKLHGEAVNQIEFSKQGGDIEICVAVFRINTDQRYIKSHDRCDLAEGLAEAVKKAEEKVNKLGYSSTCWRTVHDIISTFKGWYARFAFITGNDSLTIGFEE